jgi:hypothetical protein
MVETSIKRFSEQTSQFKFVAFLIFAASCLRIFCCFQHNPMDYVFSDMLRHWNNGLAFPRGGYAGAGDPIVYQVYIFVLQRVVHQNRYLIALASALMSVLMPYTFYRAAREFGLGKVPALWAWALIALTPSLIGIFHYIMTETMLLLLEGLALWMTGRYLRKGGRNAFLVMIFCWTIAALTKPTVVPLAAICVLWSWWKKKTPITTLALAVVMAIVMLIPQAIRTKVEFGIYAPFGNPWLTKIMLRSGARVTQIHYIGHVDRRWSVETKDGDFYFTSPSCYIPPFEPLSRWCIRRSSENSIAKLTINSAHGERDWKQAYDSMNDDPDEWTAQWRENIILFFFEPSWPETSVGQWEGVLQYHTRWMWAPLILIVFLLNAREFLHRRFDLIPIAVTLFTLTMAFQNSVLMEGRYRKPVEPVLLLNLVWILGNPRKLSADKQPEPLHDASLSPA